MFMSWQICNTKVKGAYTFRFNTLVHPSRSWFRSFIQQLDKVWQYDTWSVENIIKLNRIDYVRYYIHCPYVYLFLAQNVIFLFQESTVKNATMCSKSGDVQMQSVVRHLLKNGNGCQTR